MATRNIKNATLPPAPVRAPSVKLEDISEEEKQRIKAEEQQRKHTEVVDAYLLEQQVHIFSLLLLSARTGTHMPNPNPDPFFVSGTITV